MSKKNREADNSNEKKTTTDGTVTVNNIDDEKQVRGSDPYSLLAGLHATKEFSIDVNKAVFVNGEVTLSSNLLVRHIKSNSEAIHLLLVDDQILTVNGKVANNPEEVLDMARESIQNVVIVTVNRQANKSPASPMRLAFQDGEEPFTRSSGAQCFVVKLSRVKGIHLGFKAKSYRGRIIITDVQENSVAFFNYKVGDSILDVNNEPVFDVDSFHKKLRQSMHRYQCCTTLVERPMSHTEISNAKVIIDVLAKSKLDPPLSNDAIAIGQREAERYLANLHKHRTLRSALRKKKKKHKKSRHSLLMGRPDEERIGTDVKNPLFLQKIPKHKAPASSLTFLPRFFQ